jgi:ribose/xylose/arabinose/galactoside ABC-type transport system permease subunit
MTIWRRMVLSEFFVLYLCVIWFAALSPITPGFATPENVANIFSSMLPLLVVALGQTVVLITGGIDLSVTSTVALASTTGALVMTGQEGLGVVMAAIAVMLAIGIAVGTANGLAIHALRMPPFIVTLTAMMFFSGFAIWLTQSRNIYELPRLFVSIGGGLAGSLTLTLGIAVTLHYVLSRTSLGRWLYAIGRNVRTALVSGVPVSQPTVAAYTISGVCAAVAAILYTGRLETGSPVLGQRILLDVIGATVIGGTSLFGGRGKVLWTVFGVLFMTIIDNSLNLLGLSNFAVLMAKGFVILGAAVLDAARQRYA